MLEMIKNLLESIRGAERKNIYAVYDDDLNSLLDSTHLKQKIDRGEEKCHFCGSRITYENLEAITKVNGDYKVICSKSECLELIHN